MYIEGLRSSIRTQEVFRSHPKLLKLHSLGRRGRGRVTVGAGFPSGTWIEMSAGAASGRPSGTVRARSSVRRSWTGSSPSGKGHRSDWSARGGRGRTSGWWRVAMGVVKVPGTKEESRVEEMEDWVETTKERRLCLPPPPKWSLRSRVALSGPEPKRGPLKGFGREQEKERR